MDAWKESASQNSHLAIFLAIRMDSEETKNAPPGMWMRR